jgi:hypothetical protein
MLIPLFLRPGYGCDHAARPAPPPRPSLLPPLVSDASAAWQERDTRYFLEQINVFVGIRGRAVTSRSRTGKDTQPYFILWIFMGIPTGQESGGATRGHERSRAVGPGFPHTREQGSTWNECGMLRPTFCTGRRNRHENVTAGPRTGSIIDDYRPVTGRTHRRLDSRPNPDDHLAVSW